MVNTMTYSIRPWYTYTHQILELHGFGLDVVEVVAWDAPEGLQGRWFRHFLDGHRESPYPVLGRGQLVDSVARHAAGHHRPEEARDGGSGHQTGQKVQRTGVEDAKIQQPSDLQNTTAFTTNSMLIWTEFIKKLFKLT